MIVTATPVHLQHCSLLFHLADMGNAQIRVPKHHYDHACCTYSPDHSSEPLLHYQRHLLANTPFMLHLPPSQQSKPDQHNSLKYRCSSSRSSTLWLAPQGLDRLRDTWASQVDLHDACRTTHAQSSARHVLTHDPIPEFTNRQPARLPYPILFHAGQSCERGQLPDASTQPSCKQVQGMQMQGTRHVATLCCHSALDCRPVYCLGTLCQE